ncbi:hypothetical protein AURDEDRAFT_160057 [Auricularia subglabra TFB-10046 SS5]|nr:hypothetical protein AURDEDRAFT_160057 [Auricularia subglabra TFB-10046 SS5]
MASGITSGSPSPSFGKVETRPSRNVTLLSDCIDMPWLRNYFLGGGINAVTGRVSSASAIRNPAASVNGNSVDERFSLHVISTREDVKRELSLTASGTVGQYLNIAPVVDCLMHGMTSLKRDVVVSSTALTFLVLYQSETTDDGQSYHHELTDEAAALAHSDLDAFRSKYGDYYVAGSRRGSIFAAVAKCSFQSSETRRLVSAALGARATSALNFEVATRIDRALSSADADIYIRLYLVGLEDTANKADPSPPTQGLRSFAEILPVLDWFKRHQERICLHALLRHYSTLAGMSDVIPKTLPILPSNFTDIEDLRDTMLSCGVLVNSLPEYAPRDGIVDGFHTAFRSLSHEVYCSQAEIVSSSALRASLLQEARRLEEDLTQFHQVRNLVHAVIRNQACEPGGKRFRAGETWTFGLHLEHSVAACKVERGPTVSIVMEGWKPGNNTKGVLERRQGEHIVGWSVTANEPECSSWRKLSDSIILGPKVEIKCRREHAWRTWFRTCSWTLTTFVVRDNAYFNLVVEKEHKYKTTMTTLVTEPTSGRTQRGTQM